MAAYAGKWKLIHSEIDNVSAFIKALGYTQEVVEYVKKLNNPENEIITEYNVASEIREVVYMGDKEVFRTQFEIGKERDFTDKAKRTSKLLTKVEGNKMTTTLKLEGYEALYVYEITGNTMTQRMTTGSVTAMRKMQRL